MQFLYTVWSSSASSFKSLAESSSHFVYLSTFRSYRSLSPFTLCRILNWNHTA